MRLEGRLVFVQSLPTTLKYYLFWVIRVGNRVKGGDVIIDTKQKYFAVKNAFISWVVIDFVDKCVYNM